MFMFCSKVLLTIDRPRLRFRTRFNNRPRVFNEPIRFEEIVIFTIIDTLNKDTKSWNQHIYSLLLQAK